MPWIPHGILGIGFDEWGNYPRHMEGKNGLRQRNPCPWSVCIRGPGHQTTGYNFICCEQLPEWYEQWTKVDIIMKIKNRKIFLTLKFMNNQIRKTIWEDLELDLALPDHIAIGFSASTGILKYFLFLSSTTTSAT